MKLSVRGGSWVLPLLAAALGCSSERVGQDDPSGAAGGSAQSEAGVVELSVSPDARTFVELSEPSRVELDGDGSKSLAWDLALQGRDVFSNGGISGPGNTSAFGPLAPPTFLSDTAPEVPILLKDRAGGALLDWYDYGGETHQLFSRYHVYGLRDGARLFKLQILSYYGEQLGAPVAALYRIRWAEVSDAAVGETQELIEIDATAGGDSTDDRQSSACVDLVSGNVTPLTPDEAALSDAWHVCFRRESVAVNGGLSGSRGVEAVDLDADLTASETEDEIQARTEDSELPRFAGADYEALTADTLSWATDGVATAFARRWLEPGTDPIELSDSVWLVLAADGASKYLLKFESLNGNLGSDTATLSLRAKAVR
ncbi:MAG TPA: HmuY family protein [Polyangiaceae bacterium]|nr:HmuY family protein [Polyangiaceae bacterium]